MTTLVALHIDGKGTWIGSDRMLTGSVKSEVQSKWAVHPNGFAIGTAGAARALNILEVECDTLLQGRPPPNEFIRRLRAVLEGHGYVPMVESPGPQIWGQDFLLASPNGIWAIDPALFIHHVPANKLWAEGSGRDYAFGAGYMTEGHEDPLFRVTSALDAAANFDDATGSGAWVAHLSPAMLQDPKVTARAPRKKVSGARRKRVA